MSAALQEDEFARRAAALGERLDAEHAQAWRPRDADLQHPQKLVGVLVRQEEGPTKGYGPAKIAVLRTADGVEWAIWLLATVLKREFARLRPAVGELVAVRYLGTVPPRDGRAGYESFRVVVDRAEAGADWDSLGDFEPTIAPPCCGECGHAEPEHAAGCSQDIPF